MEAFRLLLLFVCKHVHTHIFPFYVRISMHSNFFRRIHQFGEGGQTVHEATSFMQIMNLNIQMLLNLIKVFVCIKMKLVFTVKTFFPRVGSN